MTGIEAFVEVLARAGVRHVFGNPGTTELPLNDALARDSRLAYVFGLQEIPVLAMADGFAQASGGPAVVNVHTACGLGHGMGMLYNAHVAGTPLLVTAGLPDGRLRLGEPVLEADLVPVVRPWTKWAYEVQRVEDVPAATRRALQTALTPPTGPVFLGLPLDVQLGRAEGLDCSAPWVPDRRVRPPRDLLRRAAERLAGARRPVILAGSRVAESGAADALARVAGLLGAPVLAEAAPSHGRLPLATDHPLYAGVLSYWPAEIHKQLRDFDMALAVGLAVLRLYLPGEPEQPLPAGLGLIHLDDKPWEIGKNVPVEFGLIGDPRAGLEELGDLLAAVQTPGQAEEAARREREQAARQAARRQELRARIAAQAATRPMTPLVFMDALARALPADVAVVEEAATTHQNVFERLGLLRDPRAFFAQRGWALGWGLGAALGVKLAWPDRPVLALLGDGAALYGIQALWSAAHHGLAVTVVIANNAQYRILKVCGDALNLPGLAAPDCPGLDLTRPEVDFVGLARSLGVEAERLGEPDALSEAVRASLAGGRPRLIEAPIARG